MAKCIKKLKYILIGLLILASANIIQYNLQNSNTSVNIIGENEFIPKTNVFIYAPFTVGIGSNPLGIDPPDSYDKSSWNVINQVCEGLFTYNLSDPDMPQISWLAESYWWQDLTTLRIKLQEGVLFHDSTSFNSYAAKWNLDRINYLTNITGMIPKYEKVAQTAYLWKLPNGTGIMKQIDMVGEFNITIHLNGPYAPFLDLLSIASAGMISPTSHSQTELIDLSTGDLIGTGPFEYDGFTPNVEVNFHAFDNYWHGKANISEMVFSIISDPISRGNEMYLGNIDFLDDPYRTLYSLFQSNPDLTFDETSNPGLTYYYMVFNNKIINVTWRKAMSYAINYTYIIEDLLEDDALRSYGSVSPGFGSEFNHWLIDAPGPADNGSAVYDLAVARQTILDGLSGDPRLDPRLQANDTLDDPLWLSADLATFNYSYNNNNPFRSALYPVLNDWFDNIGITLIDGGTNYLWFIYRAYGYVPGGYDALEIFPSGWGPDYLDPFNTIDPLFSNVSPSNACQINDPFIMGNLSLALKTTNDIARKAIYWELQWRLFAELYAHAPLYHNREIVVYSNDVIKYTHNSCGLLYFYSCEWNPRIVAIVPPTVTINSPSSGAGSAYTPLIFSLSITPEYDAIWYSLDNGVTNILCGPTGQINASLWTGLTDGTYILRFYANDSVGHIGSSAVSIYKDTTDPIIIINDPDEGQVFATSPPSFDLDITELHSASLWYIIEGVASTFPITTTSGTIDSAAWSSLSNGKYNITFYAVDVVGNIGFNSVTVEKNVSGIPGAYPIVIFAIIIIGIIGLTWRQKVQIKKNRP